MTQQYCWRSFRIKFRYIYVLLTRLYYISFYSFKSSAFILILNINNGNDDNNNNNNYNSKTTTFSE